MIISNVRLGFACNSSSTHSIIMGIAKDSHTKRQAKTIFDCSDQEFQWQEFCAGTPEGILAYLAQTVRLNLAHLGDNVARIVVKEWLGVEPLEEGGIDHQSVLQLPRDRNYPQCVSEDFVRDMQRWFAEHDVAIIGGNDNREEGQKTRFNDPRHTPILDRDYSYHGKTFAKKDGDWWILFNTETGAKIRFSFNDNAKPYTKARTPELIDIKITDYCPFGCKYCYQGSTAHGQHADIEFLAYELKELEVFEVAIGGGEPTFHPRFASFLEGLDHNGIVPNFTTFGTHWVDNAKIVEAVKKYCGRIAISATDYCKVRDAYKALERCELEEKFSIQYVLGAGGYSGLEPVLDACSEFNIPLTLLGFKTTGRGKDFKPNKQDDNWVQVVKKVREEKYIPQIGIDTACANQFAKELEEIPDVLITRHEGAFSCYIDAVAQTMGPSSYCDKKEMVSYADNDRRLAILKNWLNIRPTNKPGIVNPGFVPLNVAR